jgi:FkbM family methyltransferase
MLCFDIGANIGKWTIANINEFDHIISIEAAPDIFDELVNNTQHLSNLCINYAVCNNNNEDVIFHICSSHTLSSINIDWFGDKSRFANISYKSILCKSITLDKLIQLYGVPDFIKIDVEGGEYSTISSLSQKVPILCFEWASEMNDITFKSLDHLANLGFSKFYMQNTDDYTFRPDMTEYECIYIIKDKLSKTIPKIDWGMIWAQ